jgi:acetylornithine/succinyldiaminopimelate/putrescine aminotransferase
MTAGTHGSTFGGNPLSCAASLAMIEVLESENIVATIAEKERLFKNLLQHPKIKQVRGLGFMLAIQLESFEYVLKVIQNAYKQQLLLDWFLFNDSAIRLAPPLTLSNEQIAQISEAIITSL